jgi:hypothetical protein
VSKFGDGPWFKAGKLWQGSPPQGIGGLLQLAPNDNNPYNGDPNKQWHVNVYIKRANAGAVGIYI